MHILIKPSNFISKKKLSVSGITYLADCLAYSIMTHLLWPARSEQYFLLADEVNTFGDELEEFSEAPHEIHNNYIALSQHGSNGDLSDLKKVKA